MKGLDNTVKRSTRVGRGIGPNLGVSPLGRIYDFLGTLIEHGVIVGFHSNPNDFMYGTRHGTTLQIFRKPKPASQPHGALTHTES